MVVNVRVAEKVVARNSRDVVVGFKKRRMRLEAIADAENVGKTGYRIQSDEIKMGGEVNAPKTCGLCIGDSLIQV